MGWTQFRKIPNHYSPEIQNIDEQLLTLMRQRKELSEGKHTFPDQELLHELADKFGMAVEKVSLTLHLLNGQQHPMYRTEHEELQDVLPIMRKKQSEDCEYVLTHAMQYASYSVITLEINYLKEEAGEVRLQPNLTLAVIGEQDYIVQRFGGRGGGRQAQLQYHVTPPLPQRLDRTEFSLVPEEAIQETKWVDINLNRQVDF